MKVTFSLHQPSELNDVLCLNQCCISPRCVCRGLCELMHDICDNLSSSKLVVSLPEPRTRLGNMHFLRQLPDFDSHRSCVCS